MKYIGDIAYFSAIVGINFLFVFMLRLTQWRKSFLSVAWTAFFFIVALILDLSATILFVQEWRPFILDYVRTPLYLFLAISVWALTFAAWGAAKSGKKRRSTKSATKVEISPVEKQY